MCINGVGFDLLKVFIGPYGYPDTSWFISSKWERKTEGEWVEKMKEKRWGGGWEHILLWWFEGSSPTSMCPWESHHITYLSKIQHFPHPLLTVIVCF